MRALRQSLDKFCKQSGRASCSELVGVEEFSILISICIDTYHRISLGNLDDSPSAWTLSWTSVAEAIEEIKQINFASAWEQIVAARSSSGHSTHQGVSPWTIGLADLQFRG
jgi:hypothetical protein